MEVDRATAARPFDVAIVGAGPAGSALAALLASRGVSVALIDRDRFPRDKLCGEFLSYDALPIVERLGVDLAGAPQIDHCRVVSRRRTLDFPLPHSARGISRLRLDAALHESAIRAGAEAFDGCTASAIERDHVVTDAGDFSARVVVGAWGRWGRFDAQLGRAFVRDRAHRNFGFKRHYSGSRKEHRGCIELYSFRDGYLGVNDIEDQTTNICGLVHASRIASLRGGWDAFVASVRREEPRLDELYAAYAPAQDGYLSSDPVIFRARSAVEAGVFMAGDASGIIDPLAGNGMAMAVQSALLLTPLLLRLLGRPDDRPALEREYAAAHARQFTRRIAWSRRIGALLSRPALLDVALAGRWSRLGEMLVRRTRGDYDEVSRAADAWFHA